MFNEQDLGLSGHPQIMFGIRENNVWSPQDGAVGRTEI